MTKNTDADNDCAQTRAHEIARRLSTDGRPSRLDGDVRWQLFTQAQRHDKPWRDPDQLETKRDACDTIAEMAREWDCHEGNVAKWLRAFDIDPPHGGGHNVNGLARQLLDLDPEDVTLSAEPEGSA
jgi:hypothetical protein